MFFIEQNQLAIMTDKVWHKLCENIRDGKCILMLGSEFPVELSEGDRMRETTFNKILFEKIASEIPDTPRKPADYEQTLTLKELAQLARDYTIYSDQKLADARVELKNMVANYLMHDIGDKLSSQYFDLLASMPFYFFVNTNYCDFFFNHLSKVGKKPRNYYYHFQGPQIDISNVTSGSVEIGTSAEPFVFNLYGSVREPDSIAISDYDLVQLLCKIISKDPALPADVRTVLTNEDTSILFLGFGILSKNWYFRIMLHALTLGNKKTMSYALDHFDDINYDRDPTVLFFRDELKVCLYHLDQKSFIQTLSDKYTAFTSGTNEASIASGSSGTHKAKVFVSYVREDIQKAASIVERLNSSFTVLWDQSDEFTGDWEQRIDRMINEADAFVLLQSKNLRNKPITVVNTEIRLAQERAKRFPRMEYFLFPGFIDEKTSMMDDSDCDFIKKINNWNLSDTANVDRLTTEILRCQERIKRNFNQD
jgi:hypothetical protein